MDSIKTIIHPTDFSRTSAHALELAALLAHDHRASLVVLHVAELSSYRQDVAVGDDEEQGFLEILGRRLARLRSDHPSLLVHERVVNGPAVDSILQTAAETDADLIVMGSHGRSGLGRVLLGSVAERVARRASCPVLILKGPYPSSASPRFPAIIVPTDFSGRSRRALEVASAFGDVATRVIVVHVAGTVHVASEGYAEALDHRLREFTIPGARFPVEFQLREGDAAEEILELARAVEHPLIVISSRGRHGFDRFFMGSVAERIMRGASCPVLIVRKAAASELKSESQAHSTGIMPDPLES